MHIIGGQKQDFLSTTRKEYQTKIKGRYFYISYYQCKNAVEEDLQRDSQQCRNKCYLSTLFEYNLN